MIKSPPRMFLSESVRVRQLGVVLFKARDFMDSLDGFVARASKKQVQYHNRLVLGCEN